MSRWLLFILAIVIGICGGLYYGWVINPVEYVDTSPDTLRIDYKTDVVLMIAEIYSVDRQLDQAASRLEMLGINPSSDMVRQAIRFGERAGYNDADLALMRNLAVDLQSETSSPQP
jgi:hypothetical protein